MQSQYEASVDVTGLDRTDFSEKGKAMAKVDTLYSQIDSIYYTYLSESDIDELEGIYQKISTDYSSEELTQTQQAQKELLLQQKDEILENSKNSMEQSDRETLEKLESLTAMQVDEEGNSLNDIANEQEDLLYSKLSEKEKNNIEALNSSIKELMSQGSISGIQKQGLDALFSGINNILNKSYDRLSSEEKLRVSEINSEIKELDKVING
jgi:hypothetical protein